MSIIITTGLIASISALIVFIEKDIENEKKAKEAEGWIQC